MSTLFLPYGCSVCDYRSKWEQNIKRHMVAKHLNAGVFSVIPNVPNTISNVPETIPNVPETIPNVPGTIPNIPVVISNIQLTQPNTKQCDKCLHIFSLRSGLLKHYDKCRGTVDKCQCKYCYKIFNTVKSKSNHLSVCSVRKQIIEDSKKVIVPLEPSTVITNNTNSNNTTTNITTNNITQNNTINNIQNNTTNNIIVFQKNEPMLFDHITKSSLKEILKLHNFDDVVKAFSEEVWKRKENQCVRKTNMRSSTSSVHVGNNVWESRTDKQIYPGLICNIVMTLGESSESFNFTIQKHQLQHSEDFTCDGEHGTSDEREEAALVKKMFKDTIENIKNMIFNFTRNQ